MEPSTTTPTPTPPMDHPGCGTLDSVGDLDPVEFATQNFFRVATQKKYPFAIQIRSRPEPNDRVESFWVATRISIFDRKFYIVFIKLYILVYFPKNF
jgi:hypothetical protein